MWRVGSSTRIGVSGRGSSGSVIVDLAVEQGGNCALSQVGEVVKAHDVTIVGQTNIPATVPLHSTDMYAKNVLNVLMDMVKDGAVTVDFEDEVVDKSLIIHKGEIRHERTKEAVGKLEGATA